MVDKKIIAVVGATGSQGGGLCEAILSDPGGGFACRAITRDPGKDKAKALAAKGAEVVAADLDDEASLARAFAGAHGVYGVTNYWEIFSVGKEQQHATNIARAAKAANAAHVIWSTLEDTTQWVPVSDTRMPTLQEKYKCPHFDSKGQIDHVFTDLGLPVTFLLTSFYWDNFYLFGMGPKKSEDGIYTLTFPIGKAKMPGIAAEDIGKCAYGIFKKGSEFIRKRVGIAGEHLTGAEMAEKCSKGLGIKCTFNAVSADAYRSFGFPGAEDLGNMFQIYEEFEQQYRAPRSVEASRALAPSLMNFDQWLAKNKSRIPLE
ncbi:MAG: NmrA/HSCARG family protein [Gammaproteobacteria bacterium]|nr:NmrA/HSCARG family protein [Gammaproteobacteria bacterium]